MTTKRIAIVGATGAVGREMLRELAGFRSADALAVNLYASACSAGRELSFRDRRLTVGTDPVGPFDFVLMSAGATLSRELAPRLAAGGAVVIDNSSAWRRDPEVPLVVPEVNGETLTTMSGQRGGIIANPNCAAIQIAVALKPLLESFGVVSAHVATYQSVSGAGQSGVRALGAESAPGAQGGGPAAGSPFPLPIAGNVIPFIGEGDADGHCGEELKIVGELRRLFSHPELPLTAQVARVPVVHCHCANIALVLERAVRREDLLAALRAAEGLRYAPDFGDEGHPLAMAGDPGVVVTRARLPVGEASSRCVQLWVVADNLRKGAATNAAQILRYFCE